MAGEFRSFTTKGDYVGHPSLVCQPKLCYTCLQNQELKLKELNTQEADFILDIEQMQAIWKKLDKKYQLCQTCQKMVQQHLQQQDRVLKTAMLGSNLSYSKARMPVKIKGPAVSLCVFVTQLLSTVIALLIYLPQFFPNGKRISCDKLLDFWNLSKLLNMRSGSYYNDYHFYIISEQRWCVVVSLAVICIQLLLMFSCRRMRIDIITLTCWILLLAVITFWCSPNEKCKLKEVVCTLGVSLMICTTLNVTYLYVFPRSKKKRKRLCSNPDLSHSQSTNHSWSSNSPVAKHTNTDTEITQSTTQESFDFSLSAMSLNSNSLCQRGSSAQGNSAGLPWHSCETLFRTSTPVMSECDSALVCRQERPLILPAKLKVSASPPNLIEERLPYGYLRRRDPKPDITISSDSMEEDNEKIKIKAIKRGRRSPRNNKAAAAAETFRVKTTFLNKIRRAINCWNFFLIALILSLSLNGYFILTYTHVSVKYQNVFTKVLQALKIKI